MKAVILAGGLGTRISEESILKPKPMVEIGQEPILWHIMKIYSYYGVNDFIICAGYKGLIIKNYFHNYLLRSKNVTFNLKNKVIDYGGDCNENWNVTVVDTGYNTMTGGRLLRIRDLLEDGESFHCTYGDGVADVDLNELHKFHVKTGKQATMTVVQPQARFGAVDIVGDMAIKFSEKPKGGGPWINGGFFILNKECLNTIQGDETIWERQPLENLASTSQLSVFKHTGFWRPMDTLKDKNDLNEMYTNGNAKWVKW